MTPFDHNNYQDYVTIKEAAAAIGRSVKSIRRYIESRLFTEVVKTTKEYLIHKDELKKVYKKI